MFVPEISDRAQSCLADYKRPKIIIKNLPICLWQVTIEIAAGDKIHIVDEIICSCSKTTKVENNAQCSNEIDSPKLLISPEFESAPKWTVF